MVAKLIWIMSVKHSAVNFPMSDYGSFTPLMPTKVYNDTRVSPGEFAVYNLPNGNISSVSALTPFLLLECVRLNKKRTPFTKFGTTAINVSQELSHERSHLQAELTRLKHMFLAVSRKQNVQSS